MLDTVNQGCMQPWTTDHAWASAQRVVDGHPVKPRIQALPAQTRVILPFGVVNLCMSGPNPSGKSALRGCEPLQDCAEVQ